MRGQDLEDMGASDGKHEEPASLSASEPPDSLRQRRRAIASQVHVQNVHCSDVTSFDAPMSRRL